MCVCTVCYTCTHIHVVCTVYECTMCLANTVLSYMYIVHDCCGACTCVR